VPSLQVVNALDLEGPPPGERFGHWLETRDLAGDLDPNLDHDGNGRSLFAEYAFGLTDHPAPSLVADSGQLVLRLPATREELDYALETSTDLRAWTAVLTLLGTGGATEVAVESTSPHQHFRLTVSLPTSPRTD